MTTEINRLLEAEILRRFTIAENVHNIEIPAADKQFLIQVTTKKLDRDIDKFITGSVEHHDSPFTDLTPDELINQAINESTDLPYYLYGYFHVKAARRTAGGGV